MHWLVGKPSCSKAQGLRETSSSLRPLSRAKQCNHDNVRNDDAIRQPIQPNMIM